MTALAGLASAALVGSVYLLMTVPTATWVIPICVAAFTGLVGVVQWNIQHANAEKLAEIQRDNSESLARISDDLRRNSMHYELCLKAYIDVIRSMKAILDCAQSNVASADIAPGPSSVLPTRSFYNESKSARTSLQAGGEVLRLLARPDASKVLHTFEQTLSKLDIADDQDTYTQGIIESDLENVEHLRRAVPDLERDYRALLRLAREELGTAQDGHAT